MSNAPTDLRDPIFEAFIAWLNEPDAGQTMDELAAEGTDVAMAKVQPAMDELRAQVAQLAFEKRELAAQNELLRTENATLLDAQEYRAELRQRAEQAEATIARVTALLAVEDRCGPSEDRGITCPTVTALEAALDQPKDGD